jgi:hypothetical protein
VGTFCPASSVSEQACGQGYYCPNNTIRMMCGRGTTCPDVYRIKPWVCPSGFICPDTVQPPTPCVPGQTCPIGSYDSNSIVCPEGHFCPNPASSAVPCNHSIMIVNSEAEATITAAATYCPPGSAAQKVCQEGYFCTNSSSMQVCPLGMYCPLGSRSAAPCPAGFWCPTPSQSFQCVVGQGCPEGSTEALPCPAGYRCRSPDVVEPCIERGMFCPEQTTDNGTLCPASFFCPNTSTKVACELGRLCLAGSFSHTKCPAGSFCENPTSQKACLVGDICPAGATINATCPAGYICTHPNSQVVCPAGQHCPPGTSSKSVCPKDTYSYMGQANCTACREHYTTWRWTTGGAKSEEDCALEILPPETPWGMIFLISFSALSIVVMCCTCCCVMCTRCCACPCLQKWTKPTKRMNSPKLSRNDSLRVDESDGSDDDYHSEPESIELGTVHISQDIVLDSDHSARLSGPVAGPGIGIVTDSDSDHSSPCDHKQWHDDSRGQSDTVTIKTVSE